MLPRLILIMLFLLPAMAVADCECAPDEVLPDNLFPRVRLETSMGDVVVELNRMRAPATCNNFLKYVLDGHYDGTVMHRVIPGFVVQGGGYGPDFSERTVRAPVINESGNGLANNAYTIAMARFSDPHSATSQFYFNMAANDQLNPNPRNWGYTVFGDVVEGREVLDAIATVETGFSEALAAADVPVEAVVVKRVRVE